MQTQDHDPRSASADCYVALELSRSKWLLGALLPGQETADDLLWQQVRTEAGIEGWVARDFLAVSEQ